MNRPQGNAWAALAITCMFALSAVFSLFCRGGVAARATIHVSDGTATVRDATGPQIAGGALGSAKAFRKISNLQNAKGTYLGEKVTLTIVGDLVLDESKSAFPAPPGEQKQVYTGKYRLTRGTGASQKIASIKATTTLKYAPVANAEISATVEGEIEGGAQPKLPKYLSGTFKSKFPERYEDPSQFTVEDIEMIFNDAGHRP